MPVPSTISGLRDTRVFRPKGRVVSATARIMGMGPMAMARSYFVPAESRDSSLEETKPCSP